MIKKMFQNKIALITGGSRGIGAAVAVELALHGATVIVNYRQAKDAAEHVCQTITEQHGTAFSCKADISVVSEIESMFDFIETEYGTVSILINNAGLEIRHPSTEYTEEIFDRILDTNLKGAFFCARRALLTMQAAGWGRIINISSVHEIRPTGNRSPYSISKAGLEMMTREFAFEFSRYGITVNTVVPGAIRTDMNKGVLSDPVYEKRVVDLIPARWIGETNDVAPIIRFLASEEARYINGASIAVDGGLML
ncbi:MAG: 3-oxoacyl-ACP reductase FabG [Planctomycetaceae bacterium]|jgi:NAD(P)-dependent dehydrogenase (short-subunit alcohol dehydrogenase family)|nr:3-oxoacyl-ACP reductase FabG [Planctomycetaceae bacterium]